MGRPAFFTSMAILRARTEFASALNQICSERGIEAKTVIATIEEAVLAAYKRDFGFDEDLEYAAEIDPATGATHLFCWQKGKEKKTKKEIKPSGFGRIAATVAKQVLLQKIREAEKSAVIEEYRQRVGTLVNGMVLRFEGPNIIIDVGKTEAVMPPQEQAGQTKYQLNQRLTFYLEGIRDLGKGEQIVASRAHKGLIKGLFRREVPEVSSGAVEIREIAREAGNRTKIAVFSNQAGVDPVGSCVGQKGVRVQAVINELEGEKIDIIQYNEDPVKFITAALSPAENINVKINEKEKTAVVFAPEDQLSLAIGRGGQNVRLAAKLTGFKIDIRQTEEKKKVKAKKSKIEKKAAKKKIKRAKKS